MTKIKSQDCKEALCEWVKNNHTKLIVVDPNAKEDPEKYKQKDFKKGYSKKEDGKQLRVFYFSTIRYDLDIWFLVVENGTEIEDISIGNIVHSNRNQKEYVNKFGKTMMGDFYTPVFRSKDSKGYETAFNERCLQREMGI